MSSDAELTPEEKLLAVIQQGGSGPAGTPARARSASEPAQPSAGPPPPGSKPAAVAEPTPPERKLKLAPAPPPVAAREPLPAPSVKEAAGETGIAPAATTPAPETTTQSQASSRPPLAFGRGPVVPVINRVLGVVVLVLIVLVAYSLASIRYSVAAGLQRLKATPAGIREGVPRVVEPAAPELTEFLERAKREMFVPTELRGVAATNVAAQSKLGDLKLKGIALNTAAPEESEAIIEEKSKGRCYWFKVGQPIWDTGYTLQRIFTNEVERVIVTKNRQEFELR